MSFGGLLSGIARSLPGYREGRQQAIADNWSDINNFNKARSQQIQNLWAATEFNPKAQMLYNQWTRDNFATRAANRINTLEEAGMPASLNSQLAKSFYSRWLAPMQQQNAMDEYQWAPYYRQLKAMQMQQGMANAANNAAFENMVMQQYLNGGGVFGRTLQQNATPQANTSMSSNSGLNLTGQTGSTGGGGLNLTGNSLPSFGNNGTGTLNLGGLNLGYSQTPQFSDGSNLFNYGFNDAEDFQ